MAEEGMYKAGSPDDAVVGGGNGMCQAGSLGDADSRANAFSVDTGMRKAGFVGDDAVGNGSGTRKCLGRSLLDELNIILELKEWSEGVDRGPC